jgi:hypothetical protein
MERRRLINVALGREPADVIVAGGQVLSRSRRSFDASAAQWHYRDRGRLLRGSDCRRR